MEMSDKILAAMTQMFCFRLSWLVVLVTLQSQGTSPANERSSQDLPLESTFPLVAPTGTVTKVAPKNKGRVRNRRIFFNIVLS